MKIWGIAASAAALIVATGAAAQVRTHIWSKGAVRNHSTDVCRERAKSVALTLGMASGGDTLSSWLVTPGSETTTVIRCDLPQWVLIITAGPNAATVKAQNEQIVVLYNKIGGN
ncbi:hypothetical protein [Sphingomonas sp. LT1P40]|uniref:hypothetical protein n=1 Tax=Alteristakelama amylovorans TaxID=3096166 RepID=UPI002FC851D5